MTATLIETYGIEQDLRVQCGRMKIDDARGGQHVGTDYGVLVTHEPTGVSAYVNVGRSQHGNREIAIDMILSALTHPRFRP